MSTDSSGQQRRAPSSRWYYNPAVKPLLPHLTKLAAFESTRACIVAILDFDNDWKCLSSKTSLVRFKIGVEQPFDKLILKKHQGCTQRILIIEDICPEAATRLSKLFSISDEMFANHFSGASEPQQDDSPQYFNYDPVDWYTRRLKRDFVSARWLRSYRINPNLKDEHVAISDRKFALLGKGNEFESNCNTWRMHVNFQGDGGKWSPEDGRSSGLCGNSTLASEERTTVWRGSRDGLKFVIILVDSGMGKFWKPVQPLPVKKKGRRPGQRRKRRKSTSSIARPTSLARSTTGVQSLAPPFVPPITRDPPRSSRDSHSHVDGAPPVAGIELNAMSSLTAPTVESEVSTGRQGVPSNPAGPVINEASVTSETEKSPGLEARDSQLEQSTNSGDLLMLDTSADEQTDQTAVQPTVAPANGHSIDNVLAATNAIETDVSSSELSKKKGENLINNIAVRAPCSHVTIEKAYAAGLLRSESSTREDLVKWLRYFAKSGDGLSDTLGPATAIQQIILQDISDSLRQIHIYLDAIVDLSNDEYKLEQNIVTWRQTLHYLRKELRNLHHDLDQLATFFSAQVSSLTAQSSRPIPDPQYTSISKAIASKEERLQTTFGILASSISVAEARRGIAEAESVTRLTELAFIYIPLSFSASFFGMQVKELNPDTTSIGGFFGLAAGVTILSYCIRLVTRSEILVDSKSHFMDKVRAEYDLRPNAPVKTRQILDFIANRILRWIQDKLLVFIAVTVMILAPTAGMIAVWSRQNLGSDIKLAFAAIYIIVGVLLAWFVTRSVLGIRPRFKRTPISYAFVEEVST